MNKLILTLALTLTFSCPSFAEDVKNPDLAGNWYPASKGELASLLGGYLEEARPDKVEGRIFAIIVPHAGYRFSGPVAAYGFKAVEGRKIKTVVVLGFTHFKFFDGISIYDRGSFRTPLGDIPIDTELAKAIARQDQKISFYPEAFAGENSIEMEIPFIQMVMKDVKIVPILFGNQSFDDAAMLAGALVKALAGRDDYLIVASTDMSHYHPYKEATEIDKHTINLLSKMKAKELYDETMMRIGELCGIMPVASTILAANGLGFNEIKILKYANSGDTFGARENVVGYVSALIYGSGDQPSAVNLPQKKDEKIEEGKAMLNDVERKRLLDIARQSIISFVRDGKRKHFTEDDPVLKKEMGAFVTITKGGELRGCIGNMVGRGPLFQTVADMAIEAATGDPRFPPVSPNEIDGLEIDISVLSPLKRVSSHEEVKIPGHGVLVKRGFRSGVYLPQVATETGWDKEEFLTSLCAHKAGLPPDAWKDPATEIYIFTAEVFGEKVTK